MGIPGRNERRKAETRRKITDAANALFLEKGYAGTSMEDISREADVAIRTIYLHFDSKAAVLLAHFDEWLDEFVRVVGERPAGEPLDATLARTLAELKAAERWDDDKRVEDVSVLHPVLEFIGAGAPEISGHILQRWVAAQDELTERFRASSGLPVDALEPRIDASAVFAIWMTSVLDFRERFANGTTGGSTHDVGAVTARAFVEGLPPRD